MAAVALIRILSLLLSVSAILWSADRLYTGFTEASLKSIASGISLGQTYKADVLDAVASPASDLSCGYACDPETVRSFAVVRVRQAEIVWQDGTSQDGKAAGSRAESAVRRALAVTPMDSFLWFALAWTKKNNDGFSPAVSQYLQLSYDTGANEGWIAVHRNGFVVGLLAVLPSQLRQRASDEFRGLVESNYIEDAASILTGPGWARHDELLQTIVGSPERNRAQLAQRLLGLGFDLRVPGIDRSPARPWH